MNRNEKIKLKNRITREIFKYSRYPEIILVFNQNDLADRIFRDEILFRHPLCHHDRMRINQSGGYIAMNEGK